MHEFGHLLGHEDVPATLVPDEIMSHLLGLGTRRLPTRADATNPSHFHASTKKSSAYFAAVDRLFGGEHGLKSAAVASSRRAAAAEMQLAIDWLENWLDGDGNWIEATF